MAPPPVAPAPPPPPPPPAAVENTGDVTSALLDEINKLGVDGIRAGLKKGTRGPVNEEKPVEKAAPKPVQKPKAAVAKTTRPPVCELQGKKWMVEYQSGNQECVIEVTDIKHTIYLFKCEKSVVQIKGKCNSISIDSCKKVDLVFENALSQVEIVNSDSIRVQCTGKAPSINIDGCNSVTYFMSAESVADSHIITSKSAAINVIRPDPKDLDDIIETPIPEQFCTTFKNDEWVTEAVTHDD